MPLLDFNKKETWDSLYSAHVGGEVHHFTRKARQRHIGEDGWRLKRALGLQLGQNIVLVGGGFGWIAEEWEASGLGPIVVTDTSKFIQLRKHQEAVVPILDADVLTAPGRQAIYDALGATPDWVITEDVLPTLSDIEALDFVLAVRALSAKQVAHWVSVKGGPGDDQRLNWKTLDDWKVMVAPDLAVERGATRVL